MKTLYTVFSLIFLSLIFLSCRVDVKLTLNKDGSVDVGINDGAGKAFSKMIVSAAGVGSESLFDTKEISEALSQAGFSNVKVTDGTKGTDLFVIK